MRDINDLEASLDDPGRYIHRSWLEHPLKYPFIPQMACGADFYSGPYVVQKSNKWQLNLMQKKWPSLRASAMLPPCPRCWRPKHVRKAKP